VCDFSEASVPFVFWGAMVLQGLKPSTTTSLLTICISTKKTLEREMKIDFIHFSVNIVVKEGKGPK
jgi:hypothetical protein